MRLPLLIIREVKKSYKRLGKREKFITVAVFESLIFFFTLWFLPILPFLFFISLFFIVSTTIFCLRQELSEAKYLFLLILPVFFWGSSIFFVRTITANGFLFLLASFLYGISRYSLLLTLNIYNIAAIRTIQLIRAAHAVGFLFTLICGFFIFSVIWGTRPSWWMFTILIAFFSFPLILQSLWSIDLAGFVSKRILAFSLVLTLALAEFALAFSFWPILPVIGALALVSAMYVLLGLTHSYLTQRLNQRAVWEYVGIVSVILFLVVVTTKWGR